MSSLNRLDLLLKEIEDPFVQENFRKIKRYIDCLVQEGGIGGGGGGTGSPGPPGPAGPAGPAGADGNTILNGIGAPSAATGVDGDFYLDTSTLDFYGPKTGGVWGAPVNLKGDPGTDGNTILNGSGAPNNSLGNDGDYYLDTDTYDFYGPKAGGVWPTPGQSLIGPQGPAGPGSELFQVIAQEIPADEITGSSFDLEYAPIANSEVICLNGLEWSKGASYDYTLSGQTVTILNPTNVVSGDKFFIIYCTLIGDLNCETDILDVDAGIESSDTIMFASSFFRVSETVLVNGLKIDPGEPDGYSREGGTVSFPDPYLMQGDVIKATNCNDLGSVDSHGPFLEEMFDVDNTIVTNNKVALSAPPATERVIVNGIELLKGLTRDYVVTGNEVIFNNPYLVNGDLLKVSYTT